MRFEQKIVPGASLVEIVSICNKDKSPLNDDNWRTELIGNISLCWLSGGLEEQTAYFRYAVRMTGNTISSVCLNHTNYTSKLAAQPIEIETGVYELVTQTSIYRLRILSKHEKNAVGRALLEQALRQQKE